MTKKRRSILMSVLTLMLCLSVVAGGTYALFSDQVTLTTHLQAGELDITLYRTFLESKVLDSETGFLVDVRDDEVVDFTKANSRNVFDIEEGTLIVPCCSYTSTMKIENHSDVAFGYWVEVKFNGANNLSDDLYRQILVKLDAGNNEYKAERLLNGFSLGSKSEPIDVLAIGEDDYFKVSVTFIDDDAINNSAMNETLDFDIVVHAIQVTSEK